MTNDHYYDHNNVIILDFPARTSELIPTFADLYTLFPQLSSVAYKMAGSQNGSNFWILKATS
jgi:hypothetical protein